MYNRQNDSFSRTSLNDCLVVDLGKRCDRTIRDSRNWPTILL